MSEQSESMPKKNQLSSREARILQEWGAGFEAFCRSLRWRNSGTHHIYQVQLRAPMREQGEWLLLVKAITEEGPQISFHTGEAALQTIITWGTRAEAGTIKWQPDEYPPNKYDQMAAFVTSELQYAASFGWD